MGHGVLDKSPLDEMMPAVSVLLTTQWQLVYEF